MRLHFAAPPEAGVNPFGSAPPDWIERRPIRRRAPSTE